MLHQWLSIVLASGLHALSWDLQSRRQAVCSHLVSHSSSRIRTCNSSMLLCIRRLVQLLLAGQPLPRHVAFIMDGNRRFADQLNLQRIDGHKHGYYKMKDIIQWCLGLGITTISVYAFSIDNFKRPKDEVESLMELARIKFEELLHDEDAKKWQAELRVIGDLSRAPPAIQAAAARLMQGSKENGPTKAVVNICFSYTSTEELQHAVNEVCSGIQQSDLLPDDVTSDLLYSVMRTQDCPPVDLLIRTSGEQRLSDFLLWQSSYALLHWEQCWWPEFGYVHLLRALVAWQKARPHLAALRQAAAAVAAAGVQQQQQQNGDVILADTVQQTGPWQQQQQHQWADSDVVQLQRQSHSPQQQQQQQQQEQVVLAGRSPERSLSQGLTAISEDDEVCCPHPDQQLRVQSFLSRVEREYQQRVSALAAS